MISGKSVGDCGSPSEKRGVDFITNTEFYHTILQYIIISDKSVGDCGSPSEKLGVDFITNTEF